MVQGRTAAYSLTLTSRARALVTRQSIFAIPLCPASESRNGRTESAACRRRSYPKSRFSNARSETAEVDRSRARAAAAFDDLLAAIGGGAAVVAVMTCCIMPVAGLGCRRPGGIADDRGWLALHDRLLEWCAVPAFCSSVVWFPRRVQGRADISCFRIVSWQHATGVPMERPNTECRDVTSSNVPWLNPITKRGTNAL